MAREELGAQNRERRGERDHDRRRVEEVHEFRAPIGAGQADEDPDGGAGADCIADVSKDGTATDDREVEEDHALDHPARRREGELDETQVGSGELWKYMLELVPFPRDPNHEEQVRDERPRTRRVTLLGIQAVSSGPEQMGCKNE